MADRIDVAAVSVSPDHFIGGERVSSATTFTDLSPIDEQPLAEVARGGEAEARAAVAAATAAAPGWAALGSAGRAELLHRLAEVVAHRLRVETQEGAIEVHQARFGAGANAARPRFTSEARRSSSSVAAAAPAGVRR